MLNNNISSPCYFCCNKAHSNAPYKRTGNFTHGNVVCDCCMNHDCQKYVLTFSQDSSVTQKALIPNLSKTRHDVSKNYNFGIGRNKILWVLLEKTPHYRSGIPSVFRALRCHHFVKSGQCVCVLTLPIELSQYIDFKKSWQKL